ncbi:DUF445 domain-containing protein [Brevibacillus fluminis]|uniref:DUF445 domain-containing protein n=1 Tax=Brevibacillus fluminis TaxID=511487 RepID=UPI00319EAD69
MLGLGIGMIAVNVIIGSVIGGVTNELAIRMLFRPYHPWKIGGVRVPFTPGLIPRRRDEIGIQMGRLVQEHLLTPEGVKRALAKSDLEGTLRVWLSNVALAQLGQETTLRDWLRTYLPALIAEDGSFGEAVKEPLRQVWNNGVDRWQGQMADKPLRSFLPPAGEEKLEREIESLTRSLFARLRDHVNSPEGQENLSGMIKGVLAGGGGMLGGLVGMFLNEEKLTAMLLPHLDELLRREDLANRVSGVLKRECDTLLDKPFSELQRWIGEDQIHAWREQAFVRLAAEGAKVLDKRICDLTAPLHEQVLGGWIPRLSTWAVNSLQTHVDVLFGKLPIKDIVARQVEGFPLQRVEEMIIGISGKEFRMITVLGFVLGAIIGLVQGMLTLFV